jgi:hypothetical protein
MSHDPEEPPGRGKRRPRKARADAQAAAVPGDASPRRKRDRVTLDLGDDLIRQLRYHAEEIGSDPSRIAREILSRALPRYRLQKYAEPEAGKTEAA